MSDSHDKSDDLIAELAKLMASGAAGGDSAPKPTVIKLPPLDEATIKSAPVRIPGMDAPSAAAKPAERPATSPGPAVRIPGMDRPAGVNDSMPTAPAPRPGSQFDFGRPPPSAEIKTEPMANWQTREAPKPAPQASEPPPSALKIEPVKFGAPPSPPVTPVPARPMPSEPANVALTDEADDDGTESASGPHAGAPRNQANSNDPIADLIAMEFGSGDGDASEDEPRRAAPVPHPIQSRPHAEHTPTVVQIKPVSVSARQPDGDRFTTAPTFGGGEKRAPMPMAQAPANTSFNTRRADDDVDPMDEIESLIGEAVRVELTAADKPAAEPAPVVPPLNTSFGPRRSGLRDREPQVESAEAAILAAASASDVDADQVDAPHDEDRPYKRMRVKPPRTSGIPGGMRQYVGIAVAGTLLLASGFGLYWVLGMNRGDPAEAPVLTADASPAKVEPVVPAVTPEPTSGSVVFDEIDGVADAGAEEEALVSRDETAGATVSEVARAVTPAASEGDDAIVAESGLANRKVRTVTVRPDGTIVASDDAVAGTSELPVERPNVPEIAGAEVEPSDLLTAAVAETQPSVDDAAEGATEAVSALVAETQRSAESALETPDPIDVAALTATEETPPVFDGSLSAPTPMPRPLNRNAMVGGGQTASVPLTSVSTPSGSGANAPASTPLTAITRERAAATPAPVSQASVSSSGGAYVQLSSQRNESDANASMRSVQSRLGSLLSAPLEIRRVDLGAKGIWYRVVMPTGSFQNATQSCARIKANGGDCVAING